MPKQPRDAFELKLNEEQSKALALFLCDELQMGIDARSESERDVDYWWKLYEQARTRQRNGGPWPDAADLTSYLAAEKVDSVQARLMVSTFKGDPIWTVEGFGESAARAPFLEEATQWWAEEDRISNAVDRWTLNALVEPRGLIEVYEGTEMRVTRKRVNAKAKTDPMTGALLYDEEMNLQCEMGPDGKYIQAGPMDIVVEKVVDERERVRTGPGERVIPYRDSVILPGHARDKEEIWGYGKRLWRRHAELERKAQAGMYDPEAVRVMTETGDRETTTALQRSGQAVAPQETKATAEKELWELLVLLDVNAFFEARGLKKLRGSAYDGARWYLTTLHLPSQQMLRVQHDDMERSRYVPMILFPRGDRVTEGYSGVGHKLLTIIEEHTAVRNMRADRSAVVNNQPVKRLQGALWDPIDQPFGPGAVIDVRDMQEIEPMSGMQDVSPAMIEWEHGCERNAERVFGVNDIASGQTGKHATTLGEVKMATESSYVRIDLVHGRMKEAMEDLAQIRHAIRMRQLAESPEGLEAPASLLQNLEGRGIAIGDALPDKRVTAELFAGTFRFKPSGSVESADPNAQMTNYVQALQIMPQLMTTFPLPSMDPIAASREMWRQFCRVFKIQNKQAFLGSPAQDLMQPGMNPMQMMLGGGMPGMGGMPPQLGMGMGQPPQMPMMPPPQAQGMPMAPSTNTIQ